MSQIATRRAFLEAATKLTKMRDPSMDDVAAVTGLLAQMITDMTGAPCELLLRIKTDTADKLPRH